MVNPLLYEISFPLINQSDILHLFCTGALSTSWNTMTHYSMRKETPLLPTQENLGLPFLTFCAHIFSHLFSPALSRNPPKCSKLTLRKKLWYTLIFCESEMRHKGLKMNVSTVHIAVLHSTAEMWSCCVHHATQLLDRVKLNSACLSSASYSSCE